MSSCGNPTAEGDVLMKRRPKYDRSKLCVKCRLNSGNIVIRHAVYCKNCFFSLISLRFRRTLEQHVNPKPDLHRRNGLKASGNLVIGFSGGLGSTVLLDLVHKTYLTPRDRKEHDQNPNGGCPWSKVYVTFIDISGALPGAQSEISNIQRVIENYGNLIELLPLKLEDAFDAEWWKSVGRSCSHSRHSLNIVDEELFLKIRSDDSPPADSLRSYLASLPTQTAVASAIRGLIRMLLLYTAESTQSSHVLLGTSLTSLSISLISSISQGGGYSVKEEVQEEWAYKDSSQSSRTVRIIRPLRDVGTKECAFWVWWYDLKVVRRLRFSGGRQDIGALTRDFIMGLDKNYPSTVSTITRTCSKLTTKEESKTKCLLCERPIQLGIQEWKHNISIRSYREVHAQDKSPSSRISLPSDIPNLQYPGDTHAISSRMCYACHTTWTSRSIRSNSDGRNEVPVPVWITSYLLDDDA